MKNKGNLNKGLIKKTDNQVKKHISQMSLSEVERLEKRLKKININKVTYSHHLHNKDISFYNECLTEILQDINAREIIEYNQTTMRNGRVDNRVLLREASGRDALLKDNGSTVKKKANLCVVISLDTSRIITAYWNSVCDSHKTMDWTRYDKDLKIN